MGKVFGFIAVIVFGLLAGAALFTDGLWTLRLWAVFATILVPIAFLIGLAVGGTEARGKVSGIDLAVDKMGGIYDHATKTMADIERRRPKAEPTTVQVYAPGASLPPISQRQLSGAEEVIDL